MSECNGCGGCCWPVVLPYTQEEAARVMPGDRDIMGALFIAENRRFVLNDLTQLSRKEGLRRASYMNGVSICQDNRTGEAVLIYSHFYECKHYDSDSGQCGAYEQRPPMCSDYPWYGAPPDPAKALPQACGFRADIDQPVVFTGKPVSR